VFTVLSGLLVAGAGVVVIFGGIVPWVSIAGQSVAPIREGGPDGAAATAAVAVGGVWVVLGVVSALGRRRGPRFVHWLTWPLAVAVWALVHYRAQILGQFVYIHNADVHDEAAAGLGNGIGILYAGLALGVAAPLLSLRQAWRALRT